MMKAGVLQLLALGLAECQLASECADVLPSADYHTQLCTATNEEAATLVRQRFAAAALPAPSAAVPLRALNQAAVGWLAHPPAPTNTLALPVSPPLSLSSFDVGAIKRRVDGTLQCKQSLCTAKSFSELPLPKFGAPDYVMALAPKCGSSSFHNLLQAHPAIVASNRKVLPYFVTHHPEVSSVCIHLVTLDHF